MALGLTAECFSSEPSRALFRAIVELGEGGHLIGYESIFSELSKRPDGEKLSAALIDLTNPLHVPKRNVQWHVEQLKSVVKRRRLVAASQAAITAAEDPAEDTTTILEDLSRGLTEIQIQSGSIKATLLKNFIGDVLQEIQRQSASTGAIGLPTGIPDLDEMTTGVRPGELWVIGAAPGSGKTALGTQIAVASAKAGHAAAVFSLEMTDLELGTRLLANESSVSASRYRNPSYIAKAQWAEIAQCVERLCDLPLHVDATPSLTIQEVVARARRFVRQHNCRLIVVDYIRLIKAPGKELREQVGNATDALRQLAKSENVGVIALSQLARPTGKNANARPTMFRLKESGDVEAHAHVVLLIHMGTAKDGTPTGEDEILIAKNRQGPKGPIKVTFDRDRLKFLPRADENAADASLFNEEQPRQTQ